MKWFKTIGFRLFTSMMLLVATLLLLVYLLQIFLLPSFYQNRALKNVEQASDQMKKPLQAMVNQSGYEEAYKEIKELAQRNNLCIYAFDNTSTLQIEMNAMGSSCYLHYLIRPNSSTYQQPSLIMQQYITSVEQQQQKRYYFTVTPSEQITAQLFYAEKVEVNEKPYYVFVNTPFELLDSTISVLNNQFLFISLGVLLIGVTIAFMISRQLAIPLRKMSNSAYKLANGHQNVQFDNTGYSEIDELANTLNYATFEIQKTDNLRKDLLANISHDIKTPLTMISAYAQLIQDVSHHDPEKMNQHLQLIIDEVEVLNRLLNDMMTLSQVQSNTSRIVNEVFDVLDLVNQIVKSFEATVTSQDIRIVLDHNVTRMVIGDEIKIRQVITNYISNAIKFVGEDRLILVHLLELEETGYIRIEVENHGSMIKSEDMNLIWDRYYKVNNNFSRAKQGSGLGLAISKAICEQGGYPYGVLSNQQKTVFFIEVKLASKGEYHGLSA